MAFIYTDSGLGLFPFRFNKKKTEPAPASKLLVKGFGILKKAISQAKEARQPVAQVLKDELVKNIGVVNSRIKSRATASLIPSDSAPGQLFIKSEALRRQEKLARRRAVWPYSDIQAGQYEQVPFGVYRPRQTFGPNGQPVPVYIQPPSITSRPPETVNEADTVNGEPVQSAGVVTTAQSTTTPLITQDRPFIEVTDISPEAQAGVADNETNPIFKYGLLAVGAWVLYDSFKSSKKKTRRRLSWTGY